MILKLLGLGGKRRPGRFAASLAPDDVIYAIGDVHGRADLLERLLERIEHDRERRGGDGRLLFLGDYVDRGDHSREVLDRLVRLAGDRRPAPVFLMGNHEQMLLEFVRDPVRGQRWLRYGGLETLMSYGLGAAAATAREPAALADVAGRLAETMAGHLDFLTGLGLCHRSGNVLFVHAAARPELSPDAQDVDTLLWGFDTFGERMRDDGLWVVHGHTVVSEPRVAGGVISIDTGACYTGALTAARIAADGCTFLTT